MTGVIFIVLWIVVYLTGMLISRIGREKETGKMGVLTGFFFLLCCQGVVFTAGQMLGLAFSETAMILAVVLGGAALISLLFCGREVWRKIKAAWKTAWQPMEAGKEEKVFSLPLLFLGWRMAGEGLVTGSDAIVETVRTTLFTDTMNVFHPLTGQEMEIGLIGSRKIVTLPFWYSFLSYPAEDFPLHSVLLFAGVTTLGLFLVAVYQLAVMLFRGDMKKVWRMMILVVLLVLSGDYMAGAEGYRLLHQAYRGEVIVSAVGIPCLLIVLYRLLGRFLESDFEQEKYGISLWTALFYLGLLFGGSLFVATLATGWLPLLLAGAAFLMTVLGICFCRRQRGKRQPENKESAGPEIL